MITIKADRLQDGLYNIKNGKIFKYKAKGGTVRTYEMGEIVRCKDCEDSRVYGKTTQWLACESVMEGQATDPDGYCYLGERAKNE